VQIIGVLDGANENHMASKALTKPTFGFPSAEVIGWIGTWDSVSALHAAQSRYGARLSELEAQFEVRAAKLHESYLCEVIQIHSDDEE
jgi:hypothetical protein